MSFNANNTTIKRLLSEMRKLQSEPDPSFVAGPVSDDDLFVWHFTIKGTPDSPFQGGIYHGKIVFPHNYPITPPDIYFFTPNGRFETNKKLCLSFTSYHPESWNPGWDVRTVLTSVIAFMPTKAEGAIGGYDAPDADRKKLAIESRSWKCKECSLHLDPDDLPTDKPVEEKPAENQEVTDENTHQEEAQPVETPVNTEPEQPEIKEEVEAPHVEETNTEDQTATEEQNVDEGKLENNQITENEPQKLEEIPEDEGKVELDFAQLADANEEAPQPHAEEQNQPIPVKPAQEKQENTDGINFETLKSGTISKKGSFYPCLDIPILIVFILMIFLILNSYSKHNLLQF